MTINPKTFELRNLIPADRPADVKFSCGVCGKPHAKLDAAAKELPLHKQAIAEDWAGMFRNLSKALGVALLDYANRKQFNAQLESLRGKLTAAREEHDAMPVVKADKGSAKTRRLLTETLKMLGYPLAEGDHGIETLATALHGQVTKLLNIKNADLPPPLPPRDVKAELINTAMNDADEHVGPPPVSVQDEIAEVQPTYRPGSILPGQ